MIELSVNRSLQCQHQSINRESYKQSEPGKKKSWRRSEKDYKRVMKTEDHYVAINSFKSIVEFIGDRRRQTNL